MGRDHNMSMVVQCCVPPGGPPTWAWLRLGRCRCLLLRTQPFLPASHVFSLCMQSQVQFWSRACQNAGMAQRARERYDNETQDERFVFVCTQTDEIEPTSFFSNGDTLAGKYKNGTCWRGWTLPCTSVKLFRMIYYSVDIDVQNYVSFQPPCASPITRGGVFFVPILLLKDIFRQKNCYGRSWFYAVICVKSFYLASTADMSYVFGGCLSHAVVLYLVGNRLFFTWLLRIRKKYIVFSWQALVAILFTHRNT